MKHLLFSVFLFGVLVGNGFYTLILMPSLGPELLLQDVWLVPSFLYARWAHKRFKGVSSAREVYPPSLS